MAKLDIIQQQKSFNQYSLPLCWSSGRRSSLQPKSNTWVRLVETPSFFSYDEALLLCQESDTKWVAWIPDHGEAVLHVNQFCPIQ